MEKMAFGFFSLTPQVLVAIVVFCRDSVRINLGRESKPYAEEWNQTSLLPLRSERD